MQKLLLPFLVFLIACNSKQDDKKKDETKNTDYLVSFDGIGPVKVSMKQAELEKLLSRKVPLSNPTDTISGSWEDSAFIKYKDIEIKLRFVRTYEDADSFYMRITRLQTSSPLCKTQNDIRIGSAKNEIIDAFENYLLIMAPDYADTSYTTRSKTHYSIIVREDWEGRQIIFYLKDNKVYNIEVGSFYDDSE
jgi:plasmid maintenance system killer protein